MAWCMGQLVLRARARTHLAAVRHALRLHDGQAVHVSAQHHHRRALAQLSHEPGAGKGEPAAGR